MRKAITSLRKREGGFTLVELAVTMMMMGIVATAMMSVAMRAFKDTTTITNRGDVLADGRFALDMLTKQLRQGESVNQAASSASKITFSSYVNGTPKTIVWRVNGTSAPYALQESLNGGTSYATILSELRDTSVFTYTSHGGIVDQVSVTLPLGTNTSTVALTSDVQLRNALT